MWWTLRSLRESSPRSLLAGSVEDRGSRIASLHARRSSIFNSRSSILVFVFGALGVALLIAAALKLIGQAGGFFGAGTLLLIAILFFWSSWLRSDRKRTIQGQGSWPMARMGFRNATTRPGRSVLCIALIASAAFIIVSVDAFRRDDRAGCARQKFGQRWLSADGRIAVADRSRPEQPAGQRGTEPQRRQAGRREDRAVPAAAGRRRQLSESLPAAQPANTGAPDGFIGESRFAFQSSLAKTDEEKANPWGLLKANLGEGVVPVAADANSLTYVCI